MSAEFLARLIPRAVAHASSDDSGTGSTVQVDTQLLIDALPIAALVFQQAPGHPITCIMANRVFERLENYGRHHCVGLTLARMRGLGTSQTFVEKLQLCFVSPGVQSFAIELRERGFAKYLTCQLTPIPGAKGALARVLVTIIDRTHEKEAERQLLHAAAHDALTGLPNRTRLTERVERALGIAQRNVRQQVSLLFLNIDRFKIINESLGHVTGDELLITLARRLMSCVRAGDTLSRLGGDEFAILLEDVQTLEPALSTAQRIHDELRQPIRIGGEELYVSVSIGVASSLTGEYFAENLIQDADFAMNRSKSLGRGGTEVYQNAEHIEARALFRLETDLRHALSRRELTLHYQPIVNLQTGRLDTVEALARWRHVSGKDIPPGEFIPLAEATGVIVDLGRWALDEACRQLAEWRREGVPGAHELRVSVNVSALQFNRDDMVAAVTQTLERYGLNGSCLELEVTETAIAEQPEHAIEVLNRLKKLDVVIAMDDFGTGYSSLSSLQRLPIDMLKIDRSFVSRMLELEDSYKMVCTMLSLAKHLGKQTVAEGIESAGQAQILQTLGCAFGQGYHFSRPVDAQTLEARMRRHDGWMDLAENVPFTLV